MVFAEAFPDRTFTNPLVDLLLKSGRNGDKGFSFPFVFFCLLLLMCQVSHLTLCELISGKKNGKGLYIFEKGSKPRPDPSVLPIIEESRRLTNVMPGGKVVSDTKFNMLVARNIPDCLN